MRFPLDMREIIRGCMGHIDAGLGCAVDYRYRYKFVHVPFHDIVKVSRFGSDSGPGGFWVGGIERAEIG